MDRLSTTEQPTLKTGDEGQSVIRLQELLQRHGSEIAIDGVFDSVTLAAVISFQQRQGLLVDGIVGAQTWAALQDQKGA